MDERLAIAAARDWLGEAQLRRLSAMNSSTWAVDGGGGRYVLKISDTSDEPGLTAAAWLDEHGLQTGAPVRIEVRDGRLVALLRFVDGCALTEADRDVVGETLGRVHRLLADAPVPPLMSRWPWHWLDPDVVEDPALRLAARAAIQRAEGLSAQLTRGILHGDPAPEAFMDTGDGIAVIDWGAGCHGPLLYDLASAWMYTDAEVIAAYARTGPLGADELRHAPDLLAFRWAVQAWYFSLRLRSNDLTGIESVADNEKGLADARSGLLRPER